MLIIPTTMRYRPYCLVLLFVILQLQWRAIHSSPAELGEGEAKNDETVRVVVTFDDADAASDFARAVERMPTSPMLRSFSSEVAAKMKKNKEKLIQFHHTNAVAATMTQAELEEFRSRYSSTIVDIEKDSVSRLYSPRNDGIIPERIPYGIKAVQGDQPGIPEPSSSSSFVEDPHNCFKICILDDGLSLEHPDIAYSLGNDNIRGKVFGMEEGKFDWYNPSSDSFHGTHVTGTMLAQGGNNEGVVGIIPRPDPGICLLIGRIFDDSGWQENSIIYEGVEWCVDEGARVINMSLGSLEKFNVAEQLYQAVWNEGVLVVAAAGNEGTGDKSYPASYENVVSVGAIDDQNQRAPFSQYNDKVDVVAPGKRVFSTSTLESLVLRTAQGGDPYVALFLQYSPKLNTTLTNDNGNDNDDKNDDYSLVLVDCGIGGDSECQDADGKACLIERDEVISFVDKAESCQNGGGALAIIYNNVSGDFAGTLGRIRPNLHIPVVSLAREDGLLLKARLLESTETTTTTTTTTKLSMTTLPYGYETLDGTSMAVPHVAGIAAKIWAARPSCTNAQIRESLLSSAKHLGEGGEGSRNDEYGNGIVQAIDAYQYLLANFEEPCGDLVAPTPAPSMSGGGNDNDGNDNDDDGVGDRSEGSEGEDGNDEGCRASFARCDSNADCCSNLCRLVISSDGSDEVYGVCRSVAKTTSRYKLANDRGGAAGRRGTGGRRLEQQQQQQPPPPPNKRRRRIRGGHNGTPTS